MQELYDINRHIGSIQSAIKAKNAPLKVAQTRLEARCHRPDVELCRDPPHHRLGEEVSRTYRIFSCESFKTLKNQFFSTIEHISLVYI